MPVETQAAATQQATTQQKVDSYFQQSAGYWKQIYRDTRLLPVIYRDRRARVEAWIDALRLTRGARVLEIGCGAGLTTNMLAHRGFRVSAIDSAPAMVEQTRQLIASSGVADRVGVETGDAHRLKFESVSFDLVVAVGVIPWLHTEAAAVLEMARVLKRGGTLIVTADNSARLNRLLDPRSSPAMAPLRLGLKHFMRVVGLASSSEPPIVKKHYPPQVDRMAATAGLRKVKSCTIGFGPFSFFDRLLFSESSGVRLHWRLQSLADEGLPVLGWTGSHYLLLATKI